MTSSVHRRAGEVHRYAAAVGNPGTRRHEGWLRPLPGRQVNPATKLTRTRWPVVGVTGWAAKRKRYQIEMRDAYKVKTATKNEIVEEVRKAIGLHQCSEQRYRQLRSSLSKRDSELVGDALLSCWAALENPDTDLT